MFLTQTAAAMSPFTALAVVLAYSMLCMAAPVDDEPEFVPQATDPNVHILTIPTAASGKIMGFNYGVVGFAKISRNQLDSLSTR